LFLIDQDIVSLPEFEQATRKLQNDIETLFGDWEQRKEREFRRYQQQKAEQFEKGLSDELTKMMTNTTGPWRWQSRERFTESEPRLNN
jgi:hypothetical protein